jgi:hypothetical protein
MYVAVNEVECPLTMLITPVVKIVSTYYHQSVLARVGP